ncbi:hypothetical protein AALC25_15420 [Lachnospiraceae bacterium 29-84]
MKSTEKRMQLEKELFKRVLAGQKGRAAKQRRTLPRTKRNDS